MKSRLIAVAVILGAFACTGLGVASQTQPDNTKANKGQQGASPTADQAKNNKSDLQTMQEIRKAVVGDKSLSSDAHNVKIISTNGKVTLKGVVRSDEEKKSVEQKAVDVAGAGNVTNEMTVKPAK